MAIFKYSSLTESGRLMKGTVEASSHEQAAEMLRDMQLKVNEIVQVKDKQPKTAVGRNEFILFNQQLASITKAGIPLEKGLRQIASDVGSRKMKRLINSIAQDLEAGIPIDQAVQRHQKHFPPLYGLILKAGVETGRLTEMLTSLNRHLEIKTRTRNIILEAACYPLVVFALTAAIITFVFTMIIPTFANVLADMTDGKASLPYLTRLFIDISGNITTFWAYVGIILAVLFAVYLAMSTYPAGRRAREQIFMRIPVIGRLFHSGILAKTSETMGLLVGANCTLPTCFRLSAGSSGSHLVKHEAEIIAGHIEHGAPLMEAGRFCRILPRLFLYSVQMGSQRNELQDNLYSLARMYSEQTRILQGQIQTILMPVMIIVLGGIIATAVMAMFLPFFKILEVLS